MFRALLMGEGQLPDEYTRINWIQSNRGQYLNLGMMGTNGIHKVAVDMLLPVNTNSSTTVFGARNDSPSVRRFGNMYFSAAMTHGIWIGTSTGVLSQAHVVSERFTYSIEVNEPNQTVTTDYNGLIRTAGFNGTTITNLPLYLFGANLNNNITERGTFRIFGFRVWVDGEFVRDLVPVVDRFNEPMLFDNVTGDVFKNQGTGQFTWN